MRVAGVGDAASFKPEGPEIRFTFKFDGLKPGSNGERKRQTGRCELPDGRTLSIAVGDEQGATTPDGAVRVFVGLRSDPFYIGWVATQGVEIASQHCSGRQCAEYGRRV